MDKMLIRLQMLVSWLSIISLAQAYQITVHNQCSYTIWPGASQHNFGGAADFPLIDPQYTGFQLESGASKTIEAPDHWLGGRIWARTGCTSDGTCTVGGCPGGMQCTDYSWTAAVTLAEFGYGGSLGTFYDISLVAGFNVGAKIVPSISTCATRTCTSPSCPADQAYHQSSDTFVDRQCDISASYDVYFCPND